VIFHNATNHVFKYFIIIYLILCIKKIYFFFNLELHFQMHYNYSTVAYLVMRILVFYYDMQLKKRSNIDKLIISNLAH